MLIEFGSIGGDGGGIRPFELTLLGNHKLYVFEYSYELRQYQRYETTLSRPQTCQLLNTIDQNGWFEFDTELFDYDPASGPSEGGPSYVVSVDAWLTQRVLYPYLAPFVYENDIVDDYESCESCGAPPPVVPALSSTFKLLDSYRPDSLQLAKEAAIVVSIRDASWIDEPGDTKDWPGNLFSLSKAWDAVDCDYLAYRTFYGEQAQEIKDFLNQGALGYTEEGRVFQVNYVDVIPEAVFPACGNSSYDPLEYQLLDLHRNLTCSPDDGILQNH